MLISFVEDKHQFSESFYRRLVFLRIWDSKSMLDFSDHFNTTRTIK